MINPLLQKYEELYGKKEEDEPSFKEKQKELRVPLPITYDRFSREDCLLQVIEKIKTGEAQVSSASINVDAVGGFRTGLTTYTFEVKEWYTPY